MSLLALGSYHGPTCQLLPGEEHIGGTRTIGFGSTASRSFRSASILEFCRYVMGRTILEHRLVVLLLDLPAARVSMLSLSVRR